MLKAVQGEETESHVASHNSLCVMTRASQTWYKHIMVNVEKCDERFSITLCCVKSQNEKSTWIIGESNTTGKENVGERNHVKRIKN